MVIKRLRSVNDAVSTACRPEDHARHASVCGHIMMLSALVNGQRFRARIRSCLRRGIFAPQHPATPCANWQCLEDRLINWRLAGSQMPSGTKKMVDNRAFPAHIYLASLAVFWRSRPVTSIRKRRVASRGLTPCRAQFHRCARRWSGGISEKEGRLR